ncbi:thiamine pyrophosphate-dependent enzyme [Allokutzneria albata]|uniref:2-oxoisovalerate dehydrogenase subunit alpha n=1 Tax=Allokutzneria albata TaxID=211114 RepID=A0A1H0CGX9_ALLAB|nr:thiamine pyrophosphate-dependent enzyme [Allokutzneria albata]SDN57127.1 pyruvate dehydrogenase E1 component alpha subunit [Allokutzneria albata]
MDLLRSADRQPKPEPDVLLDAYRWMVIGRRLDRQTRELAGISGPSASQSDLTAACQVGAVLALAPRDWVFPTHREYIALIARGIDPLEALALPWGDWHCGYDPCAHRVAPQCAPAVTQIERAVGLTHAAHLDDDNIVSLVFVRGDSITEREFSEACYFAMTWAAPVVIFVQHNFGRHSRFAMDASADQDNLDLSFPRGLVARHGSAPLVDGTDVLGVFAAVTAAAERARAEHAPMIVEALPYRVLSHGGADRDGDGVEVEERAGSPVERLEAELREFGVLDDKAVRRVAEEAEAMAADLRDRLSAEPKPDPAELFDHVYAEPTPQLREQQTLLRTEQGLPGNL